MVERRRTLRDRAVDLRGEEQVEWEEELRPQLSLRDVRESTSLLPEQEEPVAFEEQPRSLRLADLPELTRVGELRERPQVLEDELGTEELRRQRQLVRRGTFERGLEAGVLQTAAAGPGIASLVRGSLGDEEGAVRSAERAQALMERAGEVAPRATFQGVLDGQDSFTDWVAGTIGQQTPIFASIAATAAATGGVGGVLAGAATGTARAAGTRAVTGAAVRTATQAAGRQATAQTARREAGKQLLRQQVLRRRGQQAGAAVGSFGAGTTLYSSDAATRLILDEDSDMPIQQRARIGLAGAAAAGAIATVPALAFLKNFGMGGTASHILARTAEEGTRRGLARTVATGAGKQAALEAPSEVLQEMAIQVAHGFVNENIHLFDDEALANYLEAGAAAALMGATMGGASSIRFNDVGASTRRILDRVRGRELENKQEVYENLPDNVREQRSADPQERWAAAETLLIGRQAADLSPAFQEQVQRLPREQRVQRTKDLGLALQIIADPTLAADTSEASTTLVRGARELAEQFFDQAGLEQAVAVTEAQLALDNDYGQRTTTEEAAATLQEQLRDVSEDQARTETRRAQEEASDVDAQDAQDAAQAEPALEQQEFPRRLLTRSDIEAGRIHPDANVTEQARRLPRDLTTRTAASGRFGDIWVSAAARTRRGVQNVKDRVRAAVDKLNAQFGEGLYEKVNYGDQAIEQFQAEFGTERVTDGIRQLVVEEAERINRQGQEKNSPWAQKDAVSNEVMRKDQQAVQELQQQIDTERTNPEPSAEDATYVEQLETQLAELNQKIVGQRAFSFNEAINFLNDNFDAIAVNQIPGALTGRETATLAPQELTVAHTQTVQTEQGPRRRVEPGKIVEPLPETRPPRQNQLVVEDAGGTQRGINAISLTQRMLGRTELAGRERSQAARQRAGERQQQEGRRTGEVSVENMLRAFASGVSDLVANHGFQITDTRVDADPQRADLQPPADAPMPRLRQFFQQLPPDLVIFRTRDGRNVTLAQAQRMNLNRILTSAELPRAAARGSQTAQRVQRQTQRRRESGRQRQERLTTLADALTSTVLRRKGSKSEPQRRQQLKTATQRRISGLKQEVSQLQNQLDAQRFGQPEFAARRKEIEQLNDRVEIGEAIQEILDTPITDAEEQIALLRSVMALEQDRRRRLAPIYRSEEARTADLIRDFQRQNDEGLYDFSDPDAIDNPSSDTLFGESLTESSQRVRQINESLRALRLKSENIPPWADKETVANGFLEIPPFSKLRKESEALREVAKNLKLPFSHIRVIDWAEAGEVFPAHDLKSVDGLVRVRVDENGQAEALIYVNEALGNSAARAGVLFHEFGHAITDMLTRQVSDADAQKIIDEFKAWYAENAAPDTTLSALKSSKRSLLNLVETQRGDLRKLSDLSAAERRYHTSFTEWMADNVARWVETNKRPRSAVEKFFARIGDALNRMVNALGLKTAPRVAQSVENLLNRMWDSDKALRRPSNVDVFARLMGAQSKVRSILTGKGREVLEGIRQQLNQDGAYNSEDGAVRATIDSFYAATDPDSASAHYALKELILAKLTRQERGILGKAFNTIPARRQLVSALEQSGYDSRVMMDDPVAVMALGYQLWQAGHLNLGTTASRVLNKIQEFVSNVIGLVTKSDQAVQIMQAIADGQIQARQSQQAALAKQGSGLNRQQYWLNRSQMQTVADYVRANGWDKNPSGLDAKLVYQTISNSKLLQQIPAQLRALIARDIRGGVAFDTILERTRGDAEYVLAPEQHFVVKDIREGAPLADAGRAVLSFMKYVSSNERIFSGLMQRARFINNAAITDFANQFYTDITSVGRDESYTAEKGRRAAAFHNRWLDITQPLTTTQEVELREVLQGQKRIEDAPDDVKTAVVNARRLFRQLRAYAVEAGLPLGDRGAGYFPWVFNADYMRTHAQAFVKWAAQDKYELGWRGLWNKSDFRERKNEALTREEREEFIRSYVNAIINDGGLADGQRPDMTNRRPTPFVKAMHVRSLDFLSAKGSDADRQFLGRFFSDDVNHTVASYIDQLVKRVEYTKRMGVNGERYEQAVQRARELGATDNELKIMEDLLRSTMGTVGLEIAPFWKGGLKLAGKAVGKDFSDINPRAFRQFQAAVVTYQNVRMLAMAALTNVADLAGIYARHGDFGIAFGAYRDGLSEVWKALQLRRIKDPKKKRAAMSELRRMAEDLGVVEQTVINDILGQFYGGNHFSGQARKINDWFFRYNGMEALTKTTRMIAVSAAQRSIAKYASQGDAKAREWLAEVGLRLEDIKLENDEVTLLTEAQKQTLLAQGGVESINGAQARLRSPAALDSDSRQALEELVRDDRLQAGMTRLVDEAVLRPAPAQRPTWGNDPNWMMFFHLKSFMYAYHERPMRRAWAKLSQGEVGPLLMLAGYVGVMIAADLLRELLLHGTDGDPRRRGWTFDDYVLDGMHRSGLYGAFTYIPDMKKTASFGRNPLLEVGGPTVSQASEYWRTFGRGRGDPSRTLQKSLPAHHVWRTGASVNDYLMDGLSGGNEDLRVALAALSNPYAEIMFTKQALDQLRDDAE